MNLLVLFELIRKSMINFKYQTNKMSQSQYYKYHIYTLNIEVLILIRFYLDN